MVRIHLPSAGSLLRTRLARISHSPAVCRCDRTIGAAAISLRDEACAYYPDSDFARKHGGFVYDHPWPKGSHR